MDQDIGESVTRLPAAQLKGAQQMADRLEKLVTVSFRDCNFDAKTFTHVHPWASGSFNSVEDCVDYN